MRLLLRAHGIDGFVQEHRFHPTRRWRFDFCWVDEKVAVEIDGLVYGGRGGHQTVDGIGADAEKHEAARALGWVVYRVPAGWLDTRYEQVIASIRALLDSRSVSPSTA